MKIMNGLSFAKKMALVSKLLFLNLVIISCNSKTDKKQNLSTNFQPIKKENSFTPSHTTNIQLIEREDGDFNTPVAINYKDPDGKVWKAPTGTITDGASIPSLFASFFGGKLNKDFLFAAIIHDAYCAEKNKTGASYQTETWQDTHHMFYNACIQNGTDIVKAGTMYAAVRLAGPRWPFKGSPFVDLKNIVEDSILIKEMEKCKNWIESKGDTLKLKHIDKWMDDKEQLLLEKFKTSK